MYLSQDSSGLKPIYASLALPEVAVITLAHRGDRRIDPLVAGPSALAAMQKAGFEKQRGGYGETWTKRQAIVSYNINLTRLRQSLVNLPGFDVEVLRASCYCERDAVEQASIQSGGCKLEILKLKIAKRLGFVEFIINFF